MAEVEEEHIVTVAMEGLIHLTQMVLEKNVMVMILLLRSVLINVYISQDEPILQGLLILQNQNLSHCQVVKQLTHRVLISENICRSGGH